MSTLRNTTRALSVALTLAASLLAAPAAATVGPPIKVEIVPPPPGVYPVQGVPFDATLRITSSETGEVENFDLTGVTRNTAGVPTWRAVGFSIPPFTPTQINALEPFDVTFTATADDPSDPVEFSFEWNGQLYKKQISLTQPPTDLAKGATGLEETEVVPDFEPQPQLTAEHITPDPYPSDRVAPKDLSAREKAEDAPRDGTLRKGYSIRVKGRLGAYREDGKFVGCDGATVRVMDSDWEWDDTLAAFTTDPFGYFDVTFSYNQSEDPDIYLEFEMANSRVVVERTNIWENNYKFKTGTHDDFTGTFKNYGTRSPANPAFWPALHIMSTATRAWRWVNNVAGFDTPSVDIQWPESDSNSWYNPFWEEIHINGGKQWRESTIAHEYGHHWIENFADANGTDYCNAGGYCDSSSKCGHCLWCEETAGDAWREGFPNMIADFVTDGLKGSYGLDALYTRNMESVAKCDDVSPAVYQDAYKTEGHIAALLRDVIDSAQDDDDAYSQGVDELDLTASQIFSMVATYEPTSPQAFINRLLISYPQLANQIWATCENNGYDLTDNTSPGIVSNLVSTSHSTSGDSPDATIQFNWTSATDNLSGIDGYSIQISSSPTFPNATKDIGDVTTYTTAELSPGIYWFNIRSVDRAGNWSASYRSVGPYTIREPYPADFAPEHWASGWTYPMMPSNPDVCGFTVCGNPVILVGASNSTYLNVAYRNNGELNSTGIWSSRIYVDGVAVGGNLNFTVPVAPGQVWTATGLGPFSIRGGRHTLGTFIDYPESQAEQNEADNKYNRQWVWTPFTLQTGFVYSRSAPPEDTAGMYSVPFLYSPNNDGLRFSKVNNAFYATVAWADDDTVDYDLWMYPQSNGPINGFDLLGGVDTQAISGRPAGCLDMVMFRYDVAGANVFDAGVTSEVESTVGYKVVKEEAQTVNLGQPVVATIAADRHLVLRQFYLPTSQSYTVEIQVDSTAGPVQMALYDSSFATGDLLDFSSHAQTDDQGHAILTDVAPGAGWHAVAIFQDPKDAPSGAASIDVDFEVYTTPADLVATIPSGWYAPVVPRPAQDGTPTSAWLPTSLNGNANDTYVNHAWKNDGPVGTLNFEAELFVDGVSQAVPPLAPLPGGATDTMNLNFPIQVKGGRHTLHIQYDIEQDVPESNEANNSYGLQYVWSPLALAPGNPVTRPTPEDPTAGWTDALAGGIQLVHPNSDGLRTPLPTVVGNDGHWQATAVMPHLGTDVDLRMHEQENSVLGGFDDVRALSGWTSDQSDFVLANYRVTLPRGFDVGVTHEEGAGDYTAEVVESVYLDANPSGSYPGHAIRTGEILDLHEVYLEAGPIGIVLVEESGVVDWGISLHESGLPFHVKSTSMLNGISWMNGESGVESIYVDPPVAGNYCLAVWKRSSKDLLKDGVYRLEFTQGATDVPDVGTRPTVSGLRSVHPNPFNPRTTLSFDVAEAGRARLSIYNLRGELIRVLTDQIQSAGRHDLVWDGTDESGRTVSSGAYFARLETARSNTSMKLMLLK